MNSMTRRSLGNIAGMCVVAVFAAMLLGSGYMASPGAPVWLRMVGVEIQAACRDAGTQWMIVSCLVAYFIACVVLGSKLKIHGSKSKPTHTSPQATKSRPRTQLFRDPDFWLTGFIVLVLLRYAFSYEAASKSVQVVVLLVGIVIGKGIGLWARFDNFLTRPSASPSPSGGERDRVRGILHVFVFLLAASAFWQLEHGREYQYRGLRRWTGAWDNPNIYGILMGVGMTLGIGLLAFRHRAGVKQSSTPLTARYLSLALLSGAVAVCGFGLIRSYSRGAWVGTSVALAWMVWAWVERVGSGPRDTKAECGKLSTQIHWLIRHKLPVLFILASILVLAFWQFRHTESPVLRRAFSVGNPNDFSWRNRVTTWTGAIQMMVDRPLVGHGWGKAEEVFREKYKPPRLEDSAAIQMNHFILLAISCGLPALGCWFAYVGLALIRFCKRNAGSFASGVQPACAASAAVLLVGFWFDGGLFNVATGSVFWVLVELTRSQEFSQSLSISAGGSFVCPQEAGGKAIEAHGSSPLVIGFRWLAAILATVALGQTVLHLLPPQLEITARSIELARNHLVQPKELQDFDYLSANSNWNGKPLKTLLQHVELANYNRELVNWKLEDETYRQFVLASQIYPMFDGDMNWRRPLWESFYPRIRKEDSLQSAAEIVVRHLRERVKIVPGQKQAASIATMWERQIADEAGFEALYVAALRSAGVPSRLNANGRAEIQMETAWKAAPAPLIRSLIR